MSLFLFLETRQGLFGAKLAADAVEIGNLRFCAWEDTASVNMGALRERNCSTCFVVVLPLVRKSSYSRLKP